MFDCSDLERLRSKIAIGWAGKDLDELMEKLDAQDKEIARVLAENKCLREENESLRKQTDTENVWNLQEAYSALESERNTLRNQVAQGVKLIEAQEWEGETYVNEFGDFYGACPWCKALMRKKQHTQDCPAGRFLSSNKAINHE